MGMESILFLTIAGISVLTLIIGCIRSHPEVLINFALRLVMGMIGIILLNEILQSLHISISVGINKITLGVLGCLGTPGFLLLYGIAAFCSWKLI